MHLMFQNPLDLLNQGLDQGGLEAVHYCIKKSNRAL
jgi:hypothetical protein